MLFVCYPMYFLSGITPLLQAYNNITQYKANLQYFLVIITASIPDPPQKLAMAAYRGIWVQAA